MFSKFKVAAVAAAFAGLTAFGASSAQATTVLQFDVNSLTAQANGTLPFSSTFTGTIVLSDDADSVLSDILINGAAQGIAAGQLADFQGEIELVNGQVVGGFFYLEDTSGNSYQASIAASGQVTDIGGGDPGPYLINGLTFNGTFSSNTFAGVDVSAWSDNQPLSGSFLQFKFGPNDQGIDVNVDADIFVVVPNPAVAAGALPLLGLIGAGYIRRRRQA